MDGVDRRLGQLAEEHGLPALVVPRLRLLLDLLADDPHAPTTVSAPEKAVETHVADSLDGLRLPTLRAADTLADIGSGAGFPGLVLGLVLPGMRVTSIESAARKCDFQRRVADATGVAVDIVHARAELWTPPPPGVAVVTARALAPLTTLVEYAAPLLRPGGVLVAWKGVRDAVEEADGAAAADAVGLEPHDVVTLPGRPEAVHRHLHLYAKVKALPVGFPRRPGMARKRPIRA